MFRGSSDEAEADIARAAKAAVAFLVAAQDERGRWLDFPEVGGGSDEWVTSYVGTALAAMPDASAQRAARLGWLALRAQPRWSGGWGYMPTYPADADSTAWALRLAESLRVRRDLRVWRARAFLSWHQRANGGVATYAFPSLMVRITGLKGSFDGWCTAHCCVTANVAHLVRFRGREPARRFLRARQRSDGSWPSYWWADCEYATTLAAEALAQSDPSSDCAAVGRAVAWACCAPAVDGGAVSATVPGGSAFATALRLRLLALSPAGVETAGPRRAAVEWLIRTQCPDGAWPSSAWLRFPPTHVVDPTSIAEWHFGRMVEAGVMVDQRRLFTTATVLTALCAMCVRAPPKGR